MRETYFSSIPDTIKKHSHTCSASHCTYQNTILSVHIQFVVVIVVVVVVDLSRDLGVSRTITAKSVPVRTVVNCRCASRQCYVHL